MSEVEASAQAWLPHRAEKLTRLTDPQAPPGPPGRPSVLVTSHLASQAARDGDSGRTLSRLGLMAHVPFRCVPEPPRPP